MRVFVSVPTSLTNNQYSHICNIAIQHVTDRTSTRLKKNVLGLICVTKVFNAEPNQSHILRTSKRFYLLTQTLVKQIQLSQLSTI